MKRALKGFEYLLVVESKYTTISFMCAKKIINIEIVDSFKYTPLICSYAALSAVALPSD